MTEGALFALFRGILAVIGSAAAASLIVTVAIVVINGPLDPQSGALASTMRVFAIATMMSTPFIAAGLLVIGLPVDLLLRRYGIRSAAAYAGCGAGGGLLVPVLLGPPMGVVSVWVPICVAYGLVTASVYWFLFPRMRPAES